MILGKFLIGAAFLAPITHTALAQAPTAPLVVDTPMVHDPVMAFEDGK